MNQSMKQGLYKLLEHMQNFLLDISKSIHCSIGLNTCQINQTEICRGYY